MCPPFLADHPFSYRREVLLALELARRGVAVWRFHYAGTGYSEGAASAVSFETMLADARAVMDTGKASAGCPVTIAGTRAGAMVAAAVAGDRPLVLWEPVAEGSAYRREGFRARIIADGGQLGRTPPDSAELLAQLRSEGSIDLLGHALHEPLHDSITQRSLVESIDGEGPVLVIESRATGLVDQLRSLGREATAASAGIPEAWWFHRTQQSDHSALAGELADVIGPRLQRAEIASAVSMPEPYGGQQCAFITGGANSCVFALLTPPRGPARGEAVLLLWGGGGMPAFGRNQVATALTRRLSERGYHVLQLDYPGRGDSPGAEPPDPIDEPAKQEVFAAARAAYAWLAARGLTRVLTIGSCQGAVAALNTADAAPELTGLALLAPPVGERYEAMDGDSAACDMVVTMHPRMRESFDSFAQSGKPLLIAYGIHDEGYQSFQAAMHTDLGSMLRAAGDRLTLTLTEERIHGFMTVSGQNATVDLVMEWITCAHG